MSHLGELQLTTTTTTTTTAKVHEVAVELRRPGRVEAEEAEWDRYGSDCFADFTV